MAWEIFCRVVDNLGDIGVCWRLAADLAQRGQPVRLWTDDASALAWMAPRRMHDTPGVQVLDWSVAERAPPAPGPVVIEAFGCHLPPAFVGRMRAAARPPCWLNLEYLSAEPVVERNHRLLSPQLSGPGQGLTKRFFYPGFTAGTGGLLREPGLLARRAAFNGPAWLSAQGVAAQPGERVVSLFCYDTAPVAALVDRLSDRPSLVLATVGEASAAVRAVLGPTLRRGAVRAHCLPRLDQADFDHLLWSTTLNHVRGEDSLVRALWAGHAFVWQIYPQADGADRPKLEALLQRLAAQHPGLADGLRPWWHAWNGWQPLPAVMPALDGDWAHATRAWRDSLAGQPDLATQLLALVAEEGVGEAG